MARRIRKAASDLKNLCEHKGSRGSQVPGTYNRGFKDVNDDNLQARTATASAQTQVGTYLLGATDEELLQGETKCSYLITAARK